MSRGLALALFVAAAGALALRLPQLDRRPMHNDEAVNAVKIQGLWERGEYRYDPDEYHGPSLYYFTLPFIWLSGAEDFSQLSERTLRSVTVAFGLALVLLLWLVRDGLGKPATLVAAVLTAISPAMVFYSRYFIHEMLLVCFTMVALAGGWRYTQTRCAGWAAVTGAGVGLMYATKETFVINLGAIGLALALTWAWSRWRDKATLDWKRGWNWKHALLALAVAAGVSMVLFTSFFSNLRGPLDSVRTYFPWLHRAGGESPHIHPWNYYLERLVWYHPARSPVWSEGLIVALALVGYAAALRRKGTAQRAETREPAQTAEAPTAALRVNRNAPSPDPSPPLGERVPGGRVRGRFRDSTREFVRGILVPDFNPAFVRFIGFYTVILTAVYSLISYKTPWCMLGFLYGMILLAGIGAVTLIRFVRVRSLQVGVGLLLLAGGAHLGWEAWRVSHPLAADRRNPYVYAQTVPNLLELVEKVRAIARVSPDGDRTVVKVIAPEHDYGPLLWYLRPFKRIGWYDSLADPYAPLMIVSAKFSAGLDEKSNKRYLSVGFFEMRPQVFFELYVEFELWKRYVETLPRPKEE